MPRLATILIVAIVSLLAVIPTAGASAQQGTVQFGAFNPGDPYNGRTDGADALEGATGRHVDIVNWYQNWGGGDWISAVQDHVVNAVLDRGRTPMITWEPWDPAAGSNQPQYALSRIANGDFDAYIKTWAVALRLLGRTVYLRPMHEMNGNWYPWSGTTNGNSPALYVAAWRRMHDIFAANGATNVRWVWAPNNVDVPGTAENRMEAYYPGAGYVDVLGVDGYNWGSTSPEHGGWQTFSEVFSSAIGRLSALGSQPIWIAEVGAAPEGGSKAAWIRDMFAKAKTLPRLEAIVWFNENKERDWRAAPDGDVASAFRPGNEQDLPVDGAGAGSDTDTRASLRLSVPRKARTGRATTVRWKATGAATVTKWYAYLNGRKVKVISSRKAPLLRKRISRAGRYRWMVVGRDEHGKKVVSATKAFRAVRGR